MTTIHTYYDAKAANEALNDYNADIEVDLRKQPGTYAYWNALTAQAEKQYDRMKHLAEVVEATLDKETREAATRAGTKTSEAVIKAAITANTKMRQVTTLMHDAKLQMSLCKGVCFALAQRKDTLLQIAMNDRAERNSNPQLYQPRITKGGRHEKVNTLLNNLSVPNEEDTESSDSNNDDTEGRVE